MAVVRNGQTVDQVIWTAFCNCTILMADDRAGAHIANSCGRYAFNGVASRKDLNNFTSMACRVAQANNVTYGALQFFSVETLSFSV